MLCRPQSDLVDISANFSLCYHDDQLLSIRMMIRSQFSLFPPFMSFSGGGWEGEDTRSLVTISLMFSNNSPGLLPRLSLPPTLGNLKTELVIQFQELRSIRA